MSLASNLSDTGPPHAVARQEATQARTAELVALHVDAVWRTLRRLGMPRADLDDGVQQVFSVLARRIEGIEPGKERSFLLGVALRVAADQRRKRRRHPEDLTEPLQLDQSAATQCSPEQLLDARRRLDVLDALIAQLPQDLAQVFVLFELEQLTMAEISRHLTVPPGTVASRLRRARERFDESCRNLEKQR